MSSLGTDFSIDRAFPGTIAPRESNERMQRCRVEDGGDIELTSPSRYIKSKAYTHTGILIFRISTSFLALFESSWKDLRPPLSGPIATISESIIKDCRLGSLANIHLTNKTTSGYWNRSMDQSIGVHKVTRILLSRSYFLDAERKCGQMGIH